LRSRKPSCSSGGERLAEERVEAYRDVLGIYQNLFFKL
jgi:hypothetical protein